MDDMGHALRLSDVSGRAGEQAAGRKPPMTQSRTTVTHPEPHDLAQADARRAVRAQRDVVVDAVVVVLLAQQPRVAMVVFLRQRAAHALGLAVVVVVLVLGLAPSQL